MRTDMFIGRVQVGTAVHHACQIVHVSLGRTQTRGNRNEDRGLNRCFHIREIVKLVNGDATCSQLPNDADNKHFKIQNSIAEQLPIHRSP